MIAAIAAVDENWAIGRDGGLLCHLPADLRHFKQLTMGFPVIMGRKTFVSLPKGALPGRLNVVVSRSPGYTAPGAVVKGSVEDALEAAAGHERAFIIGGAQIYAASIGLVDTLFLTLIHASFAKADTFFPELIPGQWTETLREEHPADERNPYGYAFVTLSRKGEP